MSRNSKTSAAQQLKLVMECRRSGKTDAHSGASKTEFVRLRFTTGYPDSAKEAVIFRNLIGMN